jgi:DNA-directed RNA polymerase subunit RPC12/RpoP
MDVRCPKCGANETDCLSDLSALMAEDFLRCTACGYAWTKPRAKGEPPCDLETKTA